MPPDLPVFWEKQTFRGFLHANVLVSQSYTSITFVLPQQGFAIQSMYTHDRSLDKSYIVRNDDLVEFPYGYHTTVGAPGYNSYFLWVMAGEYQGFYRSNDPEHEWVTAVENIEKKS